MAEIIRVGAWSGFLEAVFALNGDPDSILSAVGLDRTALKQQHHIQPLRVLIDTLNIASTRLNRTDFGLFWGRHHYHPPIGTLALAMLNAPSGRAGLELAGRFMHVHMPTFTSSIDPIPDSTADLIRIDHNLPSHWRGEQFEERSIAAINCRIGEMCGPDYAPSEVWFSHDPVSPPAIYRDAFGVTPKFGQSRVGIVVERHHLDSFRANRNPEIVRLAEAFLRGLSTKPEQKFSATVASVVRTLLEAGDCNAEKAARTLGIHERTLQRRLLAEGETFEVIQDCARRSYAEALLSQADIRIAEIAVALGYSDASAFSRSSRRWFGEAPSSVRKKMRNSPQP